MNEEGYIKFKSRWIQKEPLPKTVLEEVLFWRQKMYQHHLLGAYPDGIGFGNISQRYQDNQFIISGSATGNFQKITEQHFALVTDFDIDKNLVLCEGPIKSAAYGSPEMAREIIRLLKESSVRKKEKVFVMAGHQEGLIAFGKHLEEAASINLKLIDTL